MNIIAIDFDGTIVKHAYPKIGEPVPMALESMMELQEEEHKLILWTLRESVELTEAILYCRDYGIDFYGINENKQQKNWSLSPKAYAEYYIDDAAIGCPLIYEKTKRPYVDWPKIMVKLRSRMKVDLELKK